jgi:hypothetical protein
MCRKMWKEIGTRRRCCVRAEMRDRPEVEGFCSGCEEVALGDFAALVKQRRQRRTSGGPFPRLPLQVL